MTAPEQQPHRRLRIVPDSPAPMDAMRFWLISGIHKFAVDPRRRLGGRSRAKELLTKDRAPAPESSGAWDLLASTLDRHTVLGGMTELAAEERRVIMLAFLEGRSNREIADAVGVSIRTVKRRLGMALKHLDKYLTRTGTWLLAILLLGGGHLVGAATRLGRTAIAVRSADWTYTLASTAALGAVTAAAIASTAVSPVSVGPETAAPPVTTQAIGAPPSVAAWFSPGLRPEVAPTPQAKSHGQGRNDNESQNQTAAGHANHGKGNQGLALGHGKRPPAHSSDQESPPDQPVQA